MLLKPHNSVSPRLPTISVNELQDDNASETAEMFIKRPRVSPGDKAFRRESHWATCSQPALTALNVPTEGSAVSLTPPQDQLQQQYDNFDSKNVLLSKVIASQLGHPGLTEAEKEIIKTNKFKVWRGLNYFCHSTSFHGLPHIAASRSVFRIAYWITLVVIAVGLLIWAVTDISSTYFTYNAFIIREQKFPGSLKFPAITVCNLNRYAKSKLQKNLNYNEDQIFLASVFEDVLSTKSILNVDINLNESAAGFTNDIAAFAAGGFTQFSHDIEDMMWSCYFNNQPCSISNFTTKINVNGKCFTFNDNSSNILYTTTPGAENGLELVLNVEQYDYFLSSASSVGVKVYIHTQGDFPYFGEHLGFSASPGFHTDVVLQNEGFTYLQPPYGTCQKELRLDFFEIYTREACLDECRTKVLIKECGCRMFYMPGNATACSPIDYANCGFDLLRNFWKNYSCDCPIPCNIPDSYQHTLSYALFPAQHFPSLIERAGVLNSKSPAIPSFILTTDTNNNTRFNENKTDDFFRNNFLKITMYYNQLAQNSYTEVREYDTFQFIADFGGHLGLFTGAGFLTLFEIIEVCLGIFQPADNEP